MNTTARGLKAGFAGPGTSSRSPTESLIFEANGAGPEHVVPSPIAESPTREIALNRQLGALVPTERQWWRDRYHEIAKRGYQLRLQYHPDWQPSWLKSRKDYTVEDGHIIVRVAVVFFFLLSLRWR